MVLKIGRYIRLSSHNRLSPFSLVPPCQGTVKAPITNTEDIAPDPCQPVLDWVHTDSDTFLRRLSPCHHFRVMARKAHDLFLVALELEVEHFLGLAGIKGHGQGFE